MTSELRQLIIVGAGGQGRIVADILLRCVENGALARAAGYVDDTPGMSGATIAGLTVLGPLSALPDLEHDGVVVAVGDNASRRLLTERLLLAGERLATVIHPFASVSPLATIGAGSMISAGAVVSPGAILGRGVLLNTKASVDHDSFVSDFAHISAAATVGAHCRIGSETLIAMGSVIVSGFSVGSRTVIAAGACVVRDIPDDVMAFGIPARVRG
jgi:sugar O-acyltransferase (sialic acid O-acetyltransferase NeuD family)